jgi:hypothetical protein
MIVFRKKLGTPFRINPRRTGVQTHTLWYQTLAIFRLRRGLKKYSRTDYYVEPGSTAPVFVGQTHAAQGRLLLVVFRRVGLGIASRIFNYLNN